mgnify:CR=1 FL=1
MDDISFQIASILGPVLMVVTSSEFFNLKIWKTIDPTVVSLNGLVLLISGLVIVRSHNVWTFDWRLIVTVMGWLIVLAGVFRSYRPAAKQAPVNNVTRVFVIILFLIGSFLTYMGYFG